MITTTKELISFIKEKLSLIYDPSEAQNIAFLLVDFVYGFQKNDYILNTTLPTTFNESLLTTYLNRLLNNEPIQHVIGEVFFYDLTIKVTKDVLIPRPETEELVHHIITKHKYQPNLQIIDYCTGSGCIAISLAHQLNCSVHAFDISKEALKIAIENNAKNNTLVTFHEVDLLKETPTLTDIDIIVSNPPYVLEEEKALMSENVLQFDPHLALFVDNDKALLFYERITELALIQLKQGGLLYFEINERFGEETKEMILKKGFSTALIEKDMQGKDRFVIAIK